MKAVGQYLAQQARVGDPITYSKVVDHFPDMPPLNGAWSAHPLCAIFGELDIEDHSEHRPFRTAFVYAKETGRPGDGFFKMISKLRGISVLKSEQDAVWMEELEALIAYYKN